MTDTWIEDWNVFKAAKAKLAQATEEALVAGMTKTEIDDVVDQVVGYSYRQLTFQERVDRANLELRARGSKRRVGYNEGARYPFHVAREDGKRTFGTYDRIDDCLAAIATLDNNNLEGTGWY